MEAPNFYREVYLYNQDFLETRGDKSHRGLDQGNKVNILDNRPPVLTKNDVSLQGL